MASPMISFRASAEQAEAIRGNAQQCGLSVSEFLRRMVAPMPEPPAWPCEQAEVPIHTRAAFGDGEAFSIPADLHYRRAVEGFELP